MAAQKKAPKAKFKDGGKAVFAGYSDLPDGEEALINENDQVLISEVVEEEVDGVTEFSYKVTPLDADGEPVTDEDGDPIRDTVFESELKAPPRTRRSKTGGTGVKGSAGKGKGKAKAEKKEKPAPEPVVITDTEQVTEAISEANGDALAAAKALVQRVDMTYFALGGVLAHVLHEGLYKSLPEYKDEKMKAKEAFGLYVKNELDLDTRKAYELVGIYMTYTDVGADPEALAGIGWSFAARAVPYVTDDNLDAVLEKAREKTRDEFVDWIKTTYEPARGPLVNKAKAAPKAGEKQQKIARATYKFKAAGGAVETIGAAIEGAMKSDGVENEDEAFLHIVTSYAMHVEGNVTLQQSLEHIENQFGVVVRVISEVPEGIELDDGYLLETGEEE